MIQPPFIILAMVSMGVNCGVDILHDRALAGLGDEGRVHAHDGVVLAGHLRVETIPLDEARQVPDPREQDSIAGVIVEEGSDAFELAGDLLTGRQRETSEGGSGV